MRRSVGNGTMEKSKYKEGSSPMTLLKEGCKSSFGQALIYKFDTNIVRADNLSCAI